MAVILMLSRRFAPLFWCQFFSAFGDNFLKTALVFIILFKLGGPYAAALITLAAAIFIAPFFFISPIGGQFADRYDKGTVARWLRFIEIGVAMIAVAGFALYSVPFLFLALFLFGVIAAMFGPIKYGILPDQLAREELPTANALVEGATFIAILLGTIVGGLSAKGGGDPASLSALMIGFATLSWLTALAIPRTGAGAPDLVINWNIATAMLELLRRLREDRRLWWGALVTSWFWLCGAVALSLLPPLVKRALGGNEETVTACLAIFSIAIGVGSGLAAWIARGRIVLNTTLAGAILMGMFAIDLGWTTFGAVASQTVSVGALFTSVNGARLAIDLAGMAIAGGLYVVPAFAAIQAWAISDRRARVVAGVNVLNALFMTLATGTVAALQAAGLSTSTLFMIIGGGSLIVALIISRTMPVSDVAPAV